MCEILSQRPQCHEGGREEDLAEEEDVSTNLVPVVAAEQ